MEKFTGKDLSTHGKISQTVQKEYLKKTVWMPLTVKSRALIKFWKQAPQG